jgi:hypothetical protein
VLSLSTRFLRTKAALVLAAMYAFCALAPSLAFAFFDNPAVPFCLIDSYLSPGLYGAAHAHDDGDARHHADHAASHEDATADAHAMMHEHAVMHDHAMADEQSAPQRHPDHGGDPTDCCGLFPMVGLFGEVRIAFGPSNLVSIPLPALTGALHGRGAERINRPPIG